MTSKLTIADRIGLRLKSAAEHIREIIEQDQIYHRQLKKGSVDLEQLASGLSRMANIATEISEEISSAVAHIKEQDELTEELANQIFQGATLSMNLMEVFARSDPEQIKQFLELADYGPRAVALSNLDGSTLAAWDQAIQVEIGRRKKLGSD